MTHIHGTSQSFEHTSDQNCKCFGRYKLKERILKQNVITIHTFTKYTYTKIDGGHNIISVFCQLTNNAHTINKNTIVTLIAT